MKGLVLYAVALVGILFLTSFIDFPGDPSENDDASLSGNGIKLTWAKSADGWKINNVMIEQNGSSKSFGIPSGEYGYIYSPEKPSRAAHMAARTGTDEMFPDNAHFNLNQLWYRSLAPANLNTSGEHFFFYPSTCVKGKNKINFTHESGFARINSEWRLDPRYKGEICVKLSLTCLKEGYFSLLSPSVITVPRSQLAWGMVPGHCQGSFVQNDFVSSYAYGIGLPSGAVVFPDRNVTSLSPLVSSIDGNTVSVMPDSTYDRDPWEKNKITQEKLKLGLSHMNARAELCPTLYYPIHGEEGSYLTPGQTITFSCRYSLKHAPWFEVFKHAVSDIFQFPDFSAIKHTAISISDRIMAINHFVREGSANKWKSAMYKGNKIGGWAYALTGHDGQKETMIRNPDVASEWMVAHLNDDSAQQNDLRNFVLAQRLSRSPLLSGALTDFDYFPSQSAFKGMWGNYVQPFGISSAIVELSAMYAVSPKDDSLKKSIVKAAGKLVAWQEDDGSWPVAIDIDNEKLIYTDLQDLRPTFYGLYAAYRMLGDKAYLEAAKKGAYWFIANAVKRGIFIGSKEEMRFMPDFTTIQAAQCLLDINRTMHDKNIDSAAVEIARIYASYIYTHPIITQTTRSVNGSEVKEQDFTQVGLGSENIGNITSATEHGPTLASCYAGFFLKTFQMTSDSLFLKMSDAAVWNRDGFINKEKGILSYYWSSLNSSADVHFQPALYHLGWMLDYLITETNIRTDGKINFEESFVLPKGGSQKLYGALPGTIFLDKATIILKEHLVSINEPDVDYLTAISKERKEVYIVFINNGNKPIDAIVTLDSKRLFKNKNTDWLHAVWYRKDGSVQGGFPPSQHLSVHLEKKGLRLLKIGYRN